MRYQVGCKRGEKDLVAECAQLCLNGFRSVRALFSCWQSGTGAEGRRRQSDIDFRGVYIYRHIYLYTYIYQTTVCTATVFCLPSLRGLTHKVSEDVVFTDITLFGYTTSNII